MLDCPSNAYLLLPPILANANVRAEIPLVDLAAMGGWKATQTIVKCYQKPDEITQRDALVNRATLRTEGLVSPQWTPSMDTIAPLAPDKKNPASA
jgi:hypothetical protein